MLPNFFAHEKAKKGPHCCTQVSPGLVYHEHQIPLGHKGKIWVCFLDDHSESANTLYGCLTRNRMLGRQLVPTVCRSICDRETRSARTADRRRGRL